MRNAVPKLIYLSFVFLCCFVLYNGPILRVMPTKAELSNQVLADVICKSSDSYESILYIC